LKNENTQIAMHTPAAAETGNESAPGARRARPQAQLPIYPSRAMAAAVHQSMLLCVLLAVTSSAASAAPSPSREWLRCAPLHQFYCRARVTTAGGIVSSCSKS
jgi:hypothetical protein